MELLKEADIVVTNPPFSLFREYVAQLVEYDKKFIIIGNTNSLTYKEIFRMFKDDSIRTGYTNFNVGMHFYVPDSWEIYHKVEDGRKVVRVASSCWFTNLEVKNTRKKSHSTGDTRLMSTPIMIIMTQSMWIGTQTSPAIMMEQWASRLPFLINIIQTSLKLSNFAKAMTTKIYQ